MANEMSWKECVDEGIITKTIPDEEGSNQMLTMANLRLKFWDKKVADDELRREWGKPTYRGENIDSAGIGIKWIGARGLGLYKFTISVDCSINSERTEDDHHRVIILQMYQ